MASLYYRILYKSTAFFIILKKISVNYITVLDSNVKIVYNECNEQFRKEKSMKKFLALFLCILMALPISFFGCTKDEKESEDVTLGPVSGVADERLELDVPDIDFGDDYTFTIIGKGGSGWNAEDMLCPEEDSDDVLDHAKYARYKAVEDMYGIKIVTQLKEDIYTVVKNSVSSNDKSFDMIYMNTYNTASAATDNLLYNLYDVELLNLDAPWYDQNYNNGMSIGTTLYSTVNHMLTMDMHCTWVMMYNKELITRYGLKDPYDMVKDNTWTFDNFAAMLEGVSTDNGDGIWDSNDIYGFAAHSGSARNFFYGAGMTVCDKNSANYPELVIDDNENIVKLQSKAVKLLHEGNTTLFHRASDDFSIADVFREGRVLFLAEIAGYLNYFREMEQDYGIVPYPKYSADQKSYYTTNDPCIMVMSLPAFNHTSEEIQHIATVTESLCWESYYTLSPSYYEDVLGGKGTRDEGSYEMIELCRESRIYDFGLFNPDISLHNAFESLIENSSTNYASLVKRRIKGATAELQEIIERYEKA